METRQLEHEGFEHIDEFRVPLYREFFQNAAGRMEVVNMLAAEKSLHGGKRWILRKKPKLASNCPTCGHSYIGCNRLDCPAQKGNTERPAQKCFEGFEHTGEYRWAGGEEWVQTNDNPPMARKAGIGTCCNVWILRKTEDRPPQKQFDGFEHTNVFGWPKKGEWHQSCDGNCRVEHGSDWDTKYSSDRRWILIKKDDSYKKRVEELEKDLAEEAAVRELQRKRIHWLAEELTQARSKISELRKDAYDLYVKSCNILNRQPKPTDNAS